MDFIIKSGRLAEYTGGGGNVSIPQEVKAIGQNVFKGCKSITSVTIPASVKEIKTGAFDGCVNLVSVTMEEGVTLIGASAFRGCGLESFTIPKTVTSIDKTAFGYNKELVSLSVDPQNSKYKGQGNCIIEKESGTLVVGCNASVIPDDGSVSAIGARAFEGCGRIHALTVPQGVTSIEEFAFYKFSACESLAVLNIPNSVTKIESAAFAGTGLTSIVLPSGVTSIEGSTFSRCSALVRVTLHGGICAIGNRAFELCSALPEIDIPNGVQNLGGGIFANCTVLRSVSIPKSVTHIDGDLFFGCTDVTVYTPAKSIASKYFTAPQFAGRVDVRDLKG